ncbi:hypothetical protein BLOT_003016 [Blomia tropicalis]|nr:hypothetical protein BLOT_003016 [Blomia tropicalis]
MEPNRKTSLYTVLVRVKSLTLNWLAGDIRQKKSMNETFACWFVRSVPVDRSRPRAGNDAVVVEIVQL